MKQIIESSAVIAPPASLAGRLFVALGIVGLLLLAVSLANLRQLALPERATSQAASHVEFLSDAAQSPALRARAAAEPRQQSRIDESLTMYAAQKYAPLIESAFQPTALTEAFYEALYQRERIAVALNTSRQDPTARERVAQQEQELARHDDQLRRLLHPTDYAAFDVLKDSDVEQFQLDDYAGGIANVAPLDETSRRAVLLTKLRYKQQFRSVLLESGLLREELTPAARRIAFESVRRAFEQYTNDYLREARQYLPDDSQYALLSNYEATEFAAELDKLRATVHGD